MTAYNQALRNLELFAGKYPSADMIVSGTIPDDLADIPISIPLDIIERRPDLMARARDYMQQDIVQSPLIKPCSQVLRSQQGAITLRKNLANC